MRDILFRGKRTDNGEWVYGYYTKARYYLNEKEMHVIFAPDGEAFPRCEFSDYEEVDPETVCQFTGLYDKNGRKIFEGDIVNFYNDDGEFSPYEVRWQDSGFSVLMNGNPDLFDVLDDFFSRRCEVIGNIYDNPELLKGGNENG